MISDLLWTLLVLWWVGWSAQGVLAAFMAGKYYSTLRHPRREWFADYRPSAAVIVPFKGAEPTLADNLRSLAGQDYPDYRLVLVAESVEDSAYPILKSFVEANPGKARLIVAGVAGPHEGQKVHNHLAAIDHLEQQKGGEAVWVFADSDAVPGPSWLADLVGPLAQDKTGASTGYRWLIPQVGGGFWSHVASILNASAAGFACRPNLSHAWGGSMALRVDTARRLGLRRWLEGSLSDDYQLTRMIRASGLRVYFVVRCLVASPVRFDRAGFFEFIRRQYLITRVHAPGVFVGGLLLLLNYQLGLWSAVAFALGTVVLVPRFWGELSFLLPCIALLVVAGADQVRATIRWMLIHLAFGPATARQMRKTHLIDRFLTPLWMTINLMMVLRASVGRTIVWRGNTYRLHGPQRIERLAPSAPQGR